MIFGPTGGISKNAGGNFGRGGDIPWRPYLYMKPCTMQTNEQVEQKYSSKKILLRTVFDRGKKVWCKLL